MKQLSRLGIQRMIGTSDFAGSGGSGGNDISLAGYATEAWVEENYLSKEFFLRLFGIHGTDENDDPVDVEPNDPDTTITDIEAMFGFWTEQYISALGQGSGGGGGGGGSDTLADLIDVELTNPAAGQVLKYNGTKWVNSAASAGTVTSVGMSVPTGFTVTGSPITVSGVLGLSFAAGYSLPTTAKQTNWDAAYSWTSVSRTTLADYGITDAKFGTPGTDSIPITLGSTTQSVLTQHQSLDNYYTKSETDGKFLTISFFRSLFKAYNSSDVEVQPNDGNTATITNIKAMFGFWTEQYISALGQSSGGGGGVTLYEPLASINNLGAPSGTNKVIMWNGSSWTYSSASSGSVTGIVLGSGNPYTPVNGVVTLPAYPTTPSITINNTVKTPSQGTYDLGSYLPLSGGTMTGSIIQGSGGTYITRFTSAASQHNIGLLWQNTSESRIASISYRNTTQEMFLNSTGADTIYQDAIGKYNLVVGNGKLTYNTYNIWHAGNLDITSRGIVVGGINYNFYSASYTALNLDNAYLQLTGGTVSGSITTYTGSASTSQFIVKNYRARVGSTSSSWANVLVAMTAEGESGDSTLFRLAVYGGLNSTTNQQEVKYGYIGQGGYDNANSLRIYPTYPAWGTNKIWHAGNDGSGSGLDADLLDGHDSDYFATASSLGDYVTLGTAQTITGVKTFKSTSSVASVMAFSYGSNAGGNIYVDSNARLHIDSASGKYFVLGYGDSSDTTVSGTKALVLNSTYFSPLQVSTGVFDLGRSNARWNGIYAQTLNITSDATIGGTLGVTGAATLSSTLTVAGTTTLQNHVYISNNKYIYYRDKDDTSYKDVFRLNSNNRLIIGYGIRTLADSYTSIYAGASGMKFFTNGTTERMIITASGLVGIGSTDETNFITEKLNVKGNIKADTSDGTFIQIGGARIVWDNANNALKVVQIDGTTAANLIATGGVSALGQSSSGTTYLDQATADARYLRLTGGTVTGNITANGNISVGSTLKTTSGSASAYWTVGTSSVNSSYTLYVNGNASIKNIAIGNEQSVNTVSCAVIQTLNGRGIYIKSGSAPNYVDGTWANASDIRLKDIVSNAGASVEQIADAPVFNYKWKAGGTQVMLGTKAQYWRDVFPFGVTEGPNSYLYMDPANIALASAVMVARKVQSHEDRIAALEALSDRQGKEIVSLRAENERLINEINELKAA